MESLVIEVVMGDDTISKFLSLPVVVVEFSVDRWFN